MSNTDPSRPSSRPAPTPRLDAFTAERSEAQARLESCDHLGIKRFLSLDNAAYRDRASEGGLDAPTKELLGLVASTVLRCDDCISYHIEQCVRTGSSRGQIEDAMNVALIIGGSIVIPHARRALLMLDECISRHQSDLERVPGLDCGPC